jgi:hypothetical protein
MCIYIYMYRGVGSNKILVKPPDEPRGTAESLRRRRTCRDQMASGDPTTMCVVGARPS